MLSGDVTSNPLHRSRRKYVDIVHFMNESLSDSEPELCLRYLRQLKNGLLIHPHKLA